MTTADPSDPPRPRRWWTWAVLGAVVAVALGAVALVALGPDDAAKRGGGPGTATAAIGTVPEGVEVRTLTDDEDVVDWSRPASTSLTAEARRGSEGRSLRQVAWLDGAEPSVDQQSCTTWHGPTTSEVQPGVALRIRTDGDRTTAVTVSDNVWFSARYRWNVHLMDSAATPPIDRVGGGPTWGLGRSAYEMRPLPWRLCARVTGTTLQAKAWSVADGAAEPGWDDPDATFSVELPASAVEPGLPGIYLGHLVGGESTSFTDLATSS